MMRFTAGGAEGREEKKKEKGAGWREASPPSATEEIKHTLPVPPPGTSFLFLHPVKRGSAVLFPKQQNSIGNKMASRKIQLK